MFAFTLYGSMLDKYPGLAGYKMVFTTMAGFAVVGIVITTLLLKMIKRKQEEVA